MQCKERSLSSYVQITLTPHVYFLTWQTTWKTTKKQKQQQQQHEVDFQIRMTSREKEKRKEQEVEANSPQVSTSIMFRLVKRIFQGEGKLYRTLYDYQIIIFLLQYTLYIFTKICIYVLLKHLNHNKNNLSRRKLGKRYKCWIKSKQNCEGEGGWYVLTIRLNVSWKKNC